MGYALFCARKLALTSRVNTLNAEIMTVSQAKMDLANQISARQAAEGLRSATAAFNQASVFSNAIKDMDDLANNDDYVKLQAVQKEQEAENEKLSAESEAEIAALSAKENALDMRQQSLETQVQAAASELESVKKAEGDAIKNSQPGYVG